MIYLDDEIFDLLLSIEYYYGALNSKQPVICITQSMYQQLWWYILAKRVKKKERKSLYK